jgi:hypothetical protein
VEKTGLHGVPSMEKGIKNGTTSIHVNNNLIKKITPLAKCLGGIFYL